jgi:hypothetical protein
VATLENFITPSYADLEEINLIIQDIEATHYGANQYWYPKKMHQLSGCGPVAAANITAYLAKTFPDKYSSLYTYKDIFNKKDFIDHMVEVRKYVKPGMMGLTSVEQFSDNVLAFSEKKGVSLVPHILHEDANLQEALVFINQALLLKLPVAILVLKHPLKEMEDYEWHWMTITHLKLNAEDTKPYISVSTYGELREINLELLWNSRRPKDIIRLAYFT